MANVIKHKRGSGNDPVASDLVVGEVAIRTDVGKLFTKMDNGSVAEIAGGGSDIAINTLSSSSATGGGSATFNGSAYRFTLSAPPSVSAQQLLVSINGVIQKPVAGTGQPSEGFSVDGTDIILGDAPATGSDFFILTFKSLGVSEPADNSVTSAKIVDGAIVNADINASAAIAGTKISPDFGSQTITTTGNVNPSYVFISGTAPGIAFDETDSENDFTLSLQAGLFKLRDVDGGVDRYTVNSSGQHQFRGNVDFSAGIDVTGAITATGDLTITSATPIINLTETNANPDYRLLTDGGEFVIQNDQSGSFATKFKINADGHIDIAGNTDFGAGIDVTGAITGTGDLTIDTNTLHVDSSNNRVGIGTTSPSEKLHINNATTFNGLLISSTNNNTRATMELNGKDTSGNQVELRLGGFGDTNRGEIFTVTNHALGFATNNAAPQMVLNTNGNLGIGTTSPALLQGDGGRVLHLKGQNNPEIVLERTTSGTEAKASMRITDGEDFRIAVKDGSASTIDALTIKSNNGNVGIGTTNPVTKLELNNGSDLDNILVVRGADATTEYAAMGVTGGNAIFTAGGVGSTSAGMVFRTAASGTETERMRIDADGHFHYGKTSASFATEGFSFRNLGSGAFLMQGTRDGSGGAVIELNRQTNVGRQIEFYRGSSNLVGHIESNNTSTAYNTSGSDRTLKKNFESWNENVLNLFKGINPQKFNFIQEDDGAEKSKGFVAQDMVNNFPEAYTKGEEKDAKYFFNPSGMVVYLMKALQEAVARIEALEAK